MQVQINTDKNIDGNERLENYITSEIKTTLSRFKTRLHDLKFILEMKTAINLVKETNAV